jgi:hypothetical protein
MLRRVQYTDYGPADQVASICVIPEVPTTQTRTKIVYRHV